MTTPPNTMPTTTEKVEYTAGGITTRGFLVAPEGVTGKLPAIALGHGFGMVAEGDLLDFAAVFAGRGFRCLAFDYRNLGYSSGEPRQEVDAYGQVEDFRNAVSFLRLRDDVDRDRIGIWGTSFGGGHVLVVGATDRRVKCVVSQVPTISGFLNGQRRTRSDLVPKLLRAIEADREARFRGEKPVTFPMIDPDPAAAVAYPGTSSYEYMVAQQKRSPSWCNELTLGSTEITRTYEPGVYVKRIGPTPLMMILATEDDLTPVDLQQDAFNAAHHPKRLVLVPGGHYDVYGPAFATASAAAADWFDEHLGSEKAGEA